MKVLLYGSGAREHALAWKISQSPLLEKLFLYGANDGFRHLGTEILAQNHEELLKIAVQKNINLVVIGPEAPLVEGLADKFEQVGINVIGVNKKWAALEGSKSFAKAFMDRHNIPNARYLLIDSSSNIDKLLNDFSAPFVIKADGLAAGKGVKIAPNKPDVQKIINGFLKGKFANASKKIVLEEFLTGEELSLIALWDGKTLLPFVEARDYKKLSEASDSPNTGGVGAYCPVAITDEQKNDVDSYIELLSTALRKEQADFKGVIYSGLMLAEDGVKVLEFNMRFGDPETQALMMHLDSDILEVFDKTVKQQLHQVELSWKQGVSGCVVIAANGYPENPLIGEKIENIDFAAKEHETEIFYAGVKKQGGNLISNGGRVLSICKTAKNPFPDIYKAVEKVQLKNKYFRKDIGRTIPKCE